ncbi:18449_t:CDS:1, partial [Gigaspora rosea]
AIETLIDIKRANYWFRIDKSKPYEIFKTEYKGLDIDDDITTLLDDDKYKL